MTIENMEINEKRSYTEYTLVGPTSEFSIGFEFDETINALHVLVDGEDAASAGYDVSLITPTLVKLTPPVPSGIVRLVRETDIDESLYKFTSGALFEASTMDANFEQVLHSQQEVRDRQAYVEGRVLPLVDGLEDALAKADEASKAAQEAADAAEEASQISRSDENVKLPNGQTQRDKNNTSTSVFDYFTPAELLAYKASPNSYDAWRPLQAFFDDIAANRRYGVDWSGNFCTSKALTLGTGSCATKDISGAINIVAIAAIDTVLSMRVGSNVSFGNIAIYGQGGSSYASRTCRIGLLLGNNTERTVFNKIVCMYFYEAGVRCFNKSTGTNLGNTQTYDCGSGFYNAPNDVFSLNSTWSGRVDSGSAGSNAQRSKITVGTLSPAALQSSVGVVIDDEYYHVYAIDRAAGTLEVFPTIKGTATSGNLRYFYGAGVYITGGDSSTLTIESADSQRCGAGIWLDALYAPVINALIAQSCGTGFILGSRPDSSVVGGQLSGFYCEGNNFDIVKLTRVNYGFALLSNYAMNYDKIKHCQARLASGVLNPAFANLKGMLFLQFGQLLTFQKGGDNVAEGSSTITLDTFQPNQVHTYYKDSGTFTFDMTNVGYMSKFGYDGAILTVLGSGINKVPTGTITFNAPVGYTVNGGSTASFSGFGGSARFTIYYRSATKDFLITSSVNPRVLQAYTPTSLAAGALSAPISIPVAGLVLGDHVDVSYDKPLRGCEIYGNVTAANTFVCYIKNNTTGGVLLDAGNISVKKI